MYSLLTNLCIFGFISRLKGIGLPMIDSSSLAFHKLTSFDYYSCFDEVHAIIFAFLIVTLQSSNRIFPLHY